MSDQNELVIRLKLDKSKADQESKEFRDAEKKRNKELLTDAQAAEAAKLDTVRRANRAKIQSQTELLEANKRTSEALIGFTTAAAQKGFQVITDLASAYGQALQKAMEKQKEMTANFSGQRDSLGELATLMGERADNQFTLKMARYNAATGFKQEEGRQFLTELYNSGAQFKGTRISDKEFEQYAKQTGALAVARQIRPDIVGDVAGSVLGFSDYNKSGEQASEQALGKVNSALAIMGRGKGDNAVLARQFSMLSSASLNEDEMRGTFQNSDEVAATISIAAEKHDAQAAELSKMAIRAMRGFGGKKKQAAILKEAGVTAQDGFIQALHKLAPVVERKAKQQGVKTEDILRQNFEDEGAIDALNVFLNKGVAGGGFADRAQYGKEVQGPAPALGMIKESQASERGMLRQRAAELEVARAERGAEFSKLEILRKEALAQLVREKKVDTTNSNLVDYIADKTTFGALGSTEQHRIDNRVKEILDKRTPAAAIAEAKAKGGGRTVWGAEAKQEALNRQIDAIERNGGNALGDAEAVNELKEQTKMMRDEARRPGPALQGRPRVMTQ
jgi:hypothetical protein